MGSPEYQMANSGEMPEHCREIMYEREGKRANVRNAALFQASINAMWTEEFNTFGIVSEETREKADEAGKQYLEAINGMLDNNLNIRRATT